MPTPSHRLHRAMEGVTLGVVKSTRAREQRDLEMGLAEIMQQFRVSFSGTVGTAWGFAATVVHFDFPFYYAPGQRDPDFDRPQFWYGAETDLHMAVSVVVRGWELDPENDAVVGAGIAIGVCGAIADVPYTGVAHLTFQGFSALTEDETDIE